MNDAPAQYLKWYYENNIWKRLHYRGVRTLKLPLDMWNYQELIVENDIHWIVETGTRHGGSALFFADLLDSDAREGLVVSVDVTHEALHSLAAKHPRIRLVVGDSGAADVRAVIDTLVPAARKRALLLILDSDHSAAHVLRELNALVPMLRAGDYLIVEDTIVNGHPVRPGFGPGPLEAVQQYVPQHPQLVHDAERETKFGCTFAFRGYYRVH